MGVATLAGKPFTIDPHAIAWNYSTKTSATQTLGGKVIQVFGTRISDMTVEGAFGTAGWRKQLIFLQQMKELGKAQVRAGRSVGGDAQPFRFTYTPRGWDFLVYLKEYASPEGDAVVHTNDIINPKWRLTLFVVEDNSGLAKIAQNAYISRMAEGIGWRVSEFNGPLGDLALQYQVPGGGTSASGVSTFPGAPSAGSTSGMFSPQVERWRGLVAKYFPAQYVNQALSVMACESQGNPNARNKNPVGNRGHASGLFQHLPGYWPPRAAAAGFPGADIFDPEANVAASAYLFGQTNDWRHWSCQPSVQ